MYCQLKILQRLKKGKNKLKNKIKYLQYILHSKFDIFQVINTPNYSGRESIKRSR